MGKPLKEEEAKTVLDTGKTIILIVIFVFLFIFPAFYNMITGRASVIPKPEIITKEKQCVADTLYMKEYHMQLLQDWRDKVVRENVRIYEGIGGKKYTISLTNTCLDCHSNKEKFCDQCHSYVAVTPTCWNCHFWKSTKYSWP